MDIRHFRGSLTALLILTAALVISVMFVVRIQATSDADIGKQLTSSSLATAGLASQAVTQNVYKPTIRIWIHGDSIRPSMIRTKPGIVILRVENETRSDLALVVEKVLLGETMPVARITAMNRDRRARNELVLEAGEYIYYDAARPRIKGSLIVEVPSQ